MVDDNLMHNMRGEACMETQKYSQNTPYTQLAVLVVSETSGNALQLYGVDRCLDSRFPV